MSSFFNDTATTEIYTLSLHDALPIWRSHVIIPERPCGCGEIGRRAGFRDRKSTRLNSSHLVISYAVFCFKKVRGEYNLAGLVTQGPVYDAGTVVPPVQAGRH